jgi:hypothetical protein
MSRRLIPLLLSILLQSETCPRVRGVEFRVSEIVPAPMTVVPGAQTPYVIRGNEDFVSPRRFELVLYPEDLDGIDAGDVVVISIIKPRD